MAIFDQEEYGQDVQLVELDERIVSIDGVDHYLLALFQPLTGKTFIRWTPVNRDELGELIEVQPAKLPDILKHPTIYVPAKRRLTAA